jgi:hypothetical protein
MGRLLARSHGWPLREDGIDGAWLKKRPTEYFMEQCDLSLDPDERTFGAMCDLGLDRNIMWDSDFPHFDCIYPGVVKQVEDAVEDSTRDGASQHHDREPGAISSR